MKKLLLPLLLLLSVMTIEAQQKIKDGKRLYVSQNPNFLPIYGYYHELASLNQLYYMVDKYDETMDFTTYLAHDAETGHSSLTIRNTYNEPMYAIVHTKGDTMSLEYYRKKDKKPFKKETYVDMVLHGNQDYYKSEKLLSRDVYKNGILVKSLWYDENSIPTKAYIFKNNQVSQMIRLYPSGKIAQKESYNNNEVRTVYYDREGAEMEIPVPVIRKQLEDSISSYISKYHSIFSIKEMKKVGAFSYTGAVKISPDGTIQFFNDYDSVVLYNFHMRNNDIDINGNEAALSTRLLCNSLSRKESSKMITFLSSDTMSFNCPSCKEKNLTYGGRSMWFELARSTLTATNTIEKQTCKIDWQIRPQEVIYTPLTIMYSPLYYVQTGSVIEMLEDDSIKRFMGDILCGGSYRYPFYAIDMVINNGRNVVYALVNRTETALTLSLYKEKELKHLVKREQYIIEGQNRIVQHGLQDIYQEGRIIAQEEYDNDQHISTIVFNDQGDKLRKYAFENEEVVAVEQYYASGRIGVVDNLTGESANVRYFDENHNILSLQESDKNIIQKKIADYLMKNKKQINQGIGPIRRQFKGDYHATKMDFDIAMVNGGQMDFFVNLDETGKIIQAFLYNCSLMVSFDADNYGQLNINERLLKFQNNVNSALSQINDAEISCSPSLVDGKPAETSTTVRIKLPL